MGQITVTKYLCPDDIDVSNDWRPDANGDMSADAEAAGCIVAAGYGFGHDIDNATSP
ncbi:MAG: hypothetical protein H6765_09455 [Candidatus Peribacteria bacterium]|nr:MAG: hypothetical protein H6765_09455 [Candidatus Peribacteria bacterium]